MIKSVIKRLCSLFLFTTIALASWATPASAHAELLNTEPSTGQILPDAPAQVVLHFSEPVTPTQSSIKLFNGEGERREVPRATHPNGDGTTVSIPLPADLEHGQWVVVWRVISADSHPIHGALTFQAGTETPTRTNASLSNKLLASDHADLAVRVIQGVLRGIILLSTVIALGALILSVVFRKEEALFLLAYRAGGYALLVLGIATVLGLFNHGIYANAEPLSQFFDPNLARITLDTRYGYGTILRLAAVTSAALVLPEIQHRRTWWLASFGAALAVVTSFAVSGHAGTGRWPAAGIILDMFHITAGSIWFGGLLLICIALFCKSVIPDAEELRKGVQTFSRIALVCAITVLISGVLQAWRQIFSWNDLWNLDYSRLVLTKTALFLAIVAIAFFSRKATRRWGDAGTDTNVRKSLERNVFIEVLFAFAVVCVTTVLVATTPSATAAQQIIATNYDRQAPAGNITVNLHIPKTQSGIAELNVNLVDTNGKPVDAPEVNINMTLVDQGVGPLPVKLQRLGAGVYQTPNAIVPLGGIWTVSVVVRTTDIDQTATSFAVPFS